MISHPASYLGGGALVDARIGEETVNRRARVTGCEAHR
jgi:hypothetical protein